MLFDVVRWLCLECNVDLALFVVMSCLSCMFVVVICRFFCRLFFFGVCCAVRGAYLCCLLLVDASRC